MKKILLLISIAFLALSSSATIDTVTVASFSYTPSSLSINLGDTVRFIWVSGTHPTAPDTSSDWTTFPMDAANTVFDLILTSAGGYPYYCVNHGGAGGTGMSGTINVLAGATTTSIVTQPQNDTVIEGTNASFSISALNADSLQWQLDNGSGFSNLSGETSSTLNITGATLAMNGNLYRCMVYGNPNVTSNSALLVVNAVPTSGSGLVRVIIKNNEYDPAVVSIDVNDTVRFRWLEGQHPTESVEGFFPTFTLSTSDTIKDIIFTSEGVYNYFCQFHGASDGTGMFGKVLVGNVVDNIKENINNTFILAPNPFENSFNVIHNYEDLVKIQVLNALGTVVTEFNPTSMNASNLSNMESGIYFIKAMNSNNEVLKVVRAIKK